MSQVKEILTTKSYKRLGKGRKQMRVLKKFLAYTKKSWLVCYALYTNPVSQPDTLKLKD